jgi:3D (Asp-Asp-Asp) domain-containing protein
MLKVITFLLLNAFLFSQDYKGWFDPNSTYLDRGINKLEVYSTEGNDLDNSYQAYNKITWRTIAVNPQKILPGSVVFIPSLVGFKISDGFFHDGYFFAHQVLKSSSGQNIKIYVENKIDLPAKEAKVFVVQGVAAKSMRTRFELQYKIKGEKPTFKMVASDFTKLVQWGNKAIPDISQRIEKYSELGKGTPYLIYNLGEGAGSHIDPDPTIDFARTDCMTFCEHTLALAISADYEQMYDNLQKIRYNEGRISYTSRNHYTIVDWLPNNSWLLEDVTMKVGADYAKKMTKDIDRPAFYKNNGVSESELKNAPQKKSVTINYIPTLAILKIQDNLKGGEIVSIITTHPAVISAHMGIIVRDQWDNIIFRHASSSEETNEVMDERLSDYVDKLAKSKSRVGMLFMRARKDFKIPG